MNLLRCAESLVPPEAGEEGLSAVKEASLYRKYNRMRNGPLEVGSVAPELHSDLTQLHPLRGGGFSTHPWHFSPAPTGWPSGRTRPTVIVASSQS